MKLQIAPFVQGWLVAYSIPVFNVSVDVWHSPRVPPAIPDISPVGQFYINSRGSVSLLPGNDAVYVPLIYLRVDKATDLRAGDLVAVPSASGKYYHVRWVERFHLGFANEYLAGVLEQTVPAPPPAGELLLEDGTPILLEDGTFILLE